MPRGAGTEVVTVGEGLICLSPPGHELIRNSSCLVKSLGGAELNTAVGLARLGVSVRWISRVGGDDLGEELLSVLARENVDVKEVARAPGRVTGVMLKQRLTPHEARVEYYRAGSAASTLSPHDFSPSTFTGVRAVHITGIVPAIGATPRAAAFRAVRLAKRAGSTVVFDPNYRSKLWTESNAVAAYRALLPEVDHLLCNEDEAALITGLRDVRAAVRVLSRMGPRVVIVKRGARGAVALVDGQIHEVAPHPASNPVDPVGAGDAFNAGWIYGQLRSLGTEQALRLSAWVAAQVVQHPGDYEGFPDQDELRAWLRPTGDRTTRIETVR